ncbi:chromate efflux transporter [Devosia enhydra]|nr:chromate efflux transporter [Devosia enhydra]
MQRGTVREVFLAFLGLGLTSFGGPVAHIGYFRTEFVERRHWLSDADYADIVALCQFLPGPASSQVGLALGKLRAGYWGALAAWAAFTLPSVILLLIFAWGLASIGGAESGLLHGLKIAALAVVAQAVWSMGKSLVPDRGRFIVASLTAIAVLAIPSNLTQVAAIALALGLGMMMAPRAMPEPTPQIRPSVGRDWPWLGLFVLGLVALPLLATLTGSPDLRLADSLYRTGSLVFGGGHVVLPLLEGELVGPGLIDRETFLAGYGAAQAVPGPLFSFAAYAGAMLYGPPSGLWGATIALVAIYLPSAFLVFGTLGYWQALKHQPRLRGGLSLANAAVVGLLVAALYTPVFTSAVMGPRDAALAIAAYAALTALKLPPWLVVVLCALAGWALAQIS